MLISLCVYILTTFLRTAFALVACLRTMYPLQRFVFLPEYAALPAEQKAALLETGSCPPGGLPGCDDMRLNFAVDWNLLHPAMVIAFQDMNSKHVHVLDNIQG